jgi:hypothetical protein
MSLDSAEATSMTIIFNEIVKEYPNDTWQMNNYRWQAAGQAFLAAIEPFEKVIDVQAQGHWWRVFRRISRNEPDQEPIEQY